jgi:hypothetical protein
MRQLSVEASGLQIAFRWPPDRLQMIEELFQAQPRHGEHVAPRNPRGRRTRRAVI